MDSAPVSRRSMLRGGTALGLAAAGLAALPGTAAAAPGHGHLVLNYRPAQPTGWQPTDMGVGPGMPTVGRSLGGHTVSQDFAYQNKNHRIALLPLDAGANPVYAPMPADPTVNFRSTLDAAFGDYYTFRYLGGFAGRGEFSIESYSVFVNRPTSASPMLNYGMNLFLTYHPDVLCGDPCVAPQFIQVINWAGSGPSGSVLDNAGTASPFFIWGGPTSVYGKRIVSFNDSPQTGVTAQANQALSEHFLAEIFLVQDTGMPDRTGKDIVNVYGGLRYGWQVTEI